MTLTEKYDRYKYEKSIIQGDTTSFTNIPYGAHICGFYQSLEDLINLLVPFFKFGLENNEYCIWVTSEPIDNNKAKQILSEHIVNFDYYLDKKQMEFFSYSEWYLQQGTFNGNNVLNSWINKIDEAIAKGYKGIRASGTSLRNYPSF